jgi:hypothetical protein
VLEPTELGSALPTIESFADWDIHFTTSPSTNTGYWWPLDHCEMTGDEVSEVAVTEECESVGPGNAHSYGLVEIDDAEVSSGVIQGCEL